MTINDMATLIELKKYVYSLPNKCFKLFSHNFNYLLSSPSYPTQEEPASQSMISLFRVAPLIELTIPNPPKFSRKAVPMKQVSPPSMKIPLHLFPVPYFQARGQREEGVYCS